VSRLGAEGRCDDVAIKHCGHVLADLLHAGDATAATRLSLDQATLLAEDYTRGKPWDVVGLCWRGELACLAGDEDLAAKFAERVWEATANASAATINEVTTFFTLATGHAGSWDFRNWRDTQLFAWFHLGETKAVWAGVEQPLALAIVRRAFRQGIWDTSLLRSTHALQDSARLFSEPDDLPADCWVWLAQGVERAAPDDETYYQYWCNAYEALADDTNPKLAHNISVVLLAGRLLNTIAWCEPPSIQRLLEDLDHLRKSGFGSDKVRPALEMAEYVCYELTPDYLTAADRLAIAKALTDRDRPTRAESSLSAEPSPHERGPASTELIHSSLLDGVEIPLRSKIGEATWARLSSEAKREFKHAELYYTIATRAEGEGGNFDGFVLHYSKGLLAEIQESLRGPLTRDSSLNATFLDLFGENQPEWGQLLTFLDNKLERAAGTILGKRLLAQRVALSRLRELHRDFETIREYRNKAAHTGHRIDREEAIMLHTLLFNQGLIQKVTEFFPKPPRR
jgi:hypothetical protein